MFSRRPFVFSAVLGAAICIFLAALLITAGCSSDDNPSDPIASVVPELVVNPETAVISSYEGLPNEEQVRVKVDCEPYGSVVNFTFTWQESWLNATNLNGTEGGVTRDSFSIGFDVDELAAGEYHGRIGVYSEDVSNSPQYVNITYFVIPMPPDMVVEPARLNFSAPSLEHTIQPESLYVACADGSNQSYAIAESADWLDLSKSGGVTPDTVEVTVDMSSLPTGSVVDTIWLTSDDMANSPVYVVCSLFTPVWQLQQYTFANNILVDLAFADASTGWAAGYVEGTNSYSGYVLETFDGGDTWEQRIFLNAGPNEMLAFVGVEAIGSDAWAVAEHGVLYHSGDGGSNWGNTTVDLPGPETRLRSMKFVTTSVGWIVGTDGLILKTVDGGDTWDQQASGTEEDLLVVSFVDENYGWIIGYGNTLLWTDDGGDSWEQLVSPLLNGRDIFFVDANTGWIVGSSGNILRTDNGGVNWVSQSSGVTVWLQSIYFTDNQTGWAVGQNGVVLHTEDGGETWRGQYTGSSSWLYSVFFVDELRGWYGGDHSEIRFTTSGGK